MQHAPDLHEGQLVAVTQYHRERFEFPVAVGRMAVDGGTLEKAEQVDVKGKAVLVLHAWKDALWEMGASKSLDMPEPRGIEHASDAPAEQKPENDAEHAQGEVEQVAANGVSLQPESGVTEDVPTAEPSLPVLTTEGIRFERTGAILD